MNKRKRLSIPGIIMLLFLTTVYSCKKENEQQVIPEGQARVHVNIAQTSFDEETTINARSLASEPVVQVQQIKLNNDVNVIAELMPVVNSDGPVARAAVTSPVANDTRYAVLVFDGEQFVTARNYVYGKEDEAEDLILKRGKYNFIAYSLNSKTDLPNFTFTAPSDSTLSNCVVSGLHSTSDFMHFRNEMWVTGDQINNLNIIFKHKFSQLSLTLDARQIQQNIQNATMILKPIGKDIRMSLSTGMFITGNSAGQGDEVNITFPAFGSTLLVSNPVIFRQDHNTGKSSIQLNNLQIGLNPPTTTSLNFDDLILEPGKKYNMSIRFTPNDQLGTYLTYPVARIGGKVWMRHNLGVNTAVDPDALRTDFQLYGNQYHWGYKTVFSRDTITDNRLIPAIRTVTNAWNLTPTAEIPSVNTVNDPCPTGFRVPTSNEYRALLANTNVSRQGNWLIDANGSSAMILTSKTVNAVVLTFPAVGYRYNNGSGGSSVPPELIGAPFRANNLVTYWSSTSSSPNTLANVLWWGGNINEGSQGIPPIGTPEVIGSTKNLARPVRCVAATSDYVNIN